MGGGGHPFPDPNTRHSFLDIHKPPVSHIPPDAAPDAARLSPATPHSPLPVPTPQLTVVVLFSVFPQAQQAGSAQREAQLERQVRQFQSAVKALLSARSRKRRRLVSGAGETFVARGGSGVD